MVTNIILKIIEFFFFQRVKYLVILSPSFITTSTTTPPPPPSSPRSKYLFGTSFCSFLKFKMENIENFRFINL